MFRKFLDYFRDLKGEKGLISASPDRSVGRFTMLDPKRVKEQFNIIELATENGKDEIPDSSATPPDPIEEQISAHFKALENAKYLSFNNLRDKPKLPRNLGRGTPCVS